VSNAPTGTISLKGVSVSMEDAVLFNVYYIVDSVDAKPEDMGLIMWDAEPSNPTINGGGTVFEGALYDSVNNRYMVQSGGIPGKNLGDSKYIVVYAKTANGYVYSKCLTYSARKYCLNKLDSSTTSDKMKALCVAMMNYGAACQEYFASKNVYTYDTLMNVGFEQYQHLVEDYREDMMTPKIPVTAAKAGSFGLTSTSTGFTTRGATISADGNFAINYYFTTSRAVSGVKMYYWTEEAYANASVLTTSNATGCVDMVATGATNQYWANYTGIAAKHLDKTVFVCGVYEVDGVTYSTGVISYSLGHYCTSKATNTGATGTFAKATAVYSYYAKVYFGLA
jgi:hypothetical protein